jgi:CRP-like cAMP-binding protein
MSRTDPAPSMRNVMRCYEGGVPKEELERALRASHLFARIDEKHVAKIAAHTVRRSYARGDAIWREGDAATSFVVIASGLVEITRRAPNGSSAIVAIFGPHEDIGASAVVARGTYPASAIAATPTASVLLVDAAPVLDAARVDPQVAEALNASLVEHTEALQQKIRIMTAGSVAARLATLVLHLVERFGDELEDGATHVPVVLTRMELANLVGATVETTIRTLSAWQRAGILATERDGVLVKDPARLRAIAAGNDEGEGAA